MINQETIQKILDATQIVDVIGEFVSLRRRGANYVACCPFHDEKTPSFSVSPSKGIFKCFGCGKGGDAVHFIMEHEHLSYPEALKWLAAKYHIDVVEKEETAEEIANRMKSESGKLILIFWCIFTFVICGFEHSVANMTMLSLGVLLPHEGMSISVWGFVYNLLFVSLGNTIGGAVTVALPYYLIAKHDGDDRKQEKLSR